MSDKNQLPSDWDEDFSSMFLRLQRTQRDKMRYRAALYLACNGNRVKVRELLESIDNSKANDK